jgi:hypothetical protein
MIPALQVSLSEIGAAPIGFDLAAQYVQFTALVFLPSHTAYVADAVFHGMFDDAGDGRYVLRDDVWNVADLKAMVVSSVPPLSAF